MLGYVGTAAVALAIGVALGVGVPKLMSKDETVENQGPEDAAR